MKRSLSKKSKKVIEENLEELKAMPPLRKLTRIGDEDDDVTGGLRRRKRRTLRGTITRGPRRQRVTGTDQNQDGKDRQRETSG